MSSSTTQISAFVLTKEEHELLYDLTIQPGWELLMAQVNEALEVLDGAVWGAESYADVKYFQGQRDIYNWIKMLQQTTRQAMDDLNVEDV